MKKMMMIAAMGSLLAVSSFAGEIANREQVQQDRIAQGVRSGQLTPRETAHLENREARINREIRRDRNANGGRLTNAERARVNRQQNRVSRAIYVDKHNAAKR